jgi:hypothetical protein
MIKLVVALGALAATLALAHGGGWHAGWGGTHATRLAGGSDGHILKPHT